MAVTQLILGLTSNVVLAAGMLACSSGAFALFNVTAVGMWQRSVPPLLLGRVNGACSAVAGGAEALGALLGGVLVSSAGVRAPLLVGVVPLIAIAAVLCLLRPTSQMRVRGAV
jgi:predicted MFS family arabinose efflux permease